MMSQDIVKSYFLKTAMNHEVYDTSCALKNRPSTIFVCALEWHKMKALQITHLIMKEHTEAYFFSVHHAVPPSPTDFLLLVYDMAIL